RCEWFCFAANASRLFLGCRRSGLRRSRLLGRVLFAIRSLRPAVMVIAAACARQRYRGNRVLEDQLLLRSGFQNHRILVKAFDPSCELHSAHQVNRDAAALFTGTVEKAVLYCVLLLYGFFHLIDSRSKNFSG